MTSTPHASVGVVVAFSLASTGAGDVFDNVAEFEVDTLLFFNLLDLLRDFVAEGTSSVVKLTKHEDRVSLLSGNSARLEVARPVAFNCRAEASPTVDPFGAERKARRKDETDDAYLVDHTSVIYLMGPDGKFVTHFTTSDGPTKIALAVEREFDG